jgi:diguanylate cyclase (GGDEF)-like protein
MLTLGVFDYLTGFQLSFAFFYILPVSLASWSLGRRAGLVVSGYSALIWQISNLLAGQTDSMFIAVWNTITRLGFFLIISTLLTELHILLNHQTELSRTDPLTGLHNRRAFYEAGGIELRKMQRYQRPLSAAFIDVDNFKVVNDTSGHVTGDALLVRVAQSLKLYLRGTDFVARLGGDEFVVLLPETNEMGAKTVITRLQGILLRDMAQAKWPVTFSIGVLTCNAAPASTQELLHLADQLMYAAKGDGKNCAKYASYPQSLERRSPAELEAS